MFWKEESDARMEPPIHTEYFLSGAHITLILFLCVGGTKSLNSLVSLSPIPIEEKLSVHWSGSIYLTFIYTILWADSADDKLMIFFFYFPRIQDLTFHANCSFKKNK